MNKDNTKEIDMIEMMETMGNVKFSLWQKAYLRWMLRNNVKRYVKIIKQEENNND